MKVLIIYELVPEVTETYYVELAEDEFRRYSVLAGQYIGGDVMSDEDHVIAAELEKHLDGDWRSCQVSPEKLLTLYVEAVLLTGIML